jgi:hypothetical protein
VRCDDEKGGEKFKSIVKEEPLVGAALHAVCMLLVKHWVQEGDEGLHEAIDMYLAVALHQENAVAGNEDRG